MSDKDHIKTPRSSSLPPQGGDEINRVVYVKAHFKEEWVERRVLVPLEGHRISILGRWSMPIRFQRVTKDVKVATSDCEIDGERLTEDIRAATLALNEQGYRVVSVSPITSGQFSPRFDKKSRSRNLMRNAMRQIGYGFSYSEGVVVIGEKSSTPGGLKVNSSQR